MMIFDFSMCDMDITNEQSARNLWESTYFWGEKEVDVCPERVEQISSGTWKRHFFSGGGKRQRQ